MQIVNEQKSFDYLYIEIYISGTIVLYPYYICNSRIQVIDQLVPRMIFIDHPILILLIAQPAGNTGKCMEVACKGSRDLTKAQRVISTYIYLQIYTYILFFISGSFVHIIRKITD